MAREKQEREDERGVREGSRGKSREGKLRQSCGEEGGREGGSADLGRGEGKERPTVQRERREADGGDWGMGRRRGSEGPGARREAAGERRRSAVSRQRPMAEPETVRLGSETGQPPVPWCPRLQRKGSMGEAVSTAVPVLGRALSPPTPGLLADLQTPLDRNKE